MASIDDKVVSMSFESGKFQSGVSHTLSALDKLKAALNFGNSGKGLTGLSKNLDGISASARKVDLSHIGKSVDAVVGKLGYLSVAAIAVFSNIAIKAVTAGTQMAKALSLEPVTAGYSEYVTKLNSIQTILANTEAAGTTLKDVTKALKELNEYSDQTIYNFGQMAQNIGTFTAAGVDLDTSVAAIKGIANLAALSGSNAEKAATTMYQLSQEIANGKVSLLGWNSVATAGMGGPIFQRALAETAVAMGKLNEETVKLSGPMKNVTIAGVAFRNSLSEGKNAGWLTSDVLTTALSHFTGDLTDAKLAAQGFSDAQIIAIQKTAQTAKMAATQVKDLGTVFKVAKETAGSGWSETFEIVLGGYRESKKTFTELSNSINGFINASADARNKVFGDWKALGGRKVLIDGIRTAFQNLGMILKPIKEAFRDIFPAKTGEDLNKLTWQFRNFAESLKPSEQTIANLRRTFAGLFAIFSIVGQVIGEIVGLFGRLFGSIGKGTGGFLDFTGGIGDWLVKVDAAMKAGSGLHDFFLKLGDVIAKPLNFIKGIGTALSNMFSDFSPGGISGDMDVMSKVADVFRKALEGLKDLAPGVLGFLKDLGSALKPAWDAYWAFLQGLGTAIGEAAKNMNFDAILATIRTGLFAALILQLKKFFGKGSGIDQIMKSFGAGSLMQSIGNTFKTLEGGLTSLQVNVKAKTLKEIAIAVALLAGSVLALSLVNPERLTTALTGIGAMMAELVAAMAGISFISKMAGFYKLPVIAATMIIFAGAITLLTVSLIALSFLDWDSLAKGLAGVGGLLAIISAATIPLSKNAGGMIRAGIGIVAISIAMNILAIAMKQFAGMDWQEIGKGLAGVAGGLVAVAGASQAMPKGMVIIGVGLIAVAVGLKILASVMQQFANMKWESIGKGLAGIGGALLVIAGAMWAMPKGMLLQAAALVVLAFALGMIADVVKDFGGMSIEEIAKGLIVLAGSLAILAGGLYLMSGAVAGAVSLGIAAAGLALLAPALKTMGAMSWGDILKSLVLLAAALTLIGVAGIVLTPVIPSLLLLGAALLMIGAGVLAAGVGIALLGAGLAAIALSGPAAIAILITAFEGLIRGLIENAKLLVLGVLEIVNALAATAPKFVDAMIKILNSLLDAFIMIAPKMGQLVNTLIKVILDILDQNQDKIVKAAFDLVIALLVGLRNAIPQIVTLVFEIVAKFVQGLANNAGKIITAGGNLIIALIKGLTGQLGRIVTAVVDIVVRFVNGIANNLGKIVTAGGSLLVKFLQGIANNLGKVITAAADIIIALVTGIGNNSGRIVTAATVAMGKFITQLAIASVKLVDVGMKAIILFLNGVADAIDANIGPMLAAGARIGVAIAQGMLKGLASLAGAIADKARSMATNAASAAWAAIVPGSPSKVWTAIGLSMGAGMAQGLDKSGPKVYSSVVAMGNVAKDGFKNTFSSKEMRDIGQLVGRGFAEGLRGSADDIKKAFTELNDKLVDAMAKARETIGSEKEKLAKLMAAKEPDTKAIKEAQKAIAEAETLLKQSTAGHIALTRTLRDEKAVLIGLSNDYVKVSENLKKAQEVLKEATKTRDDAIKTYTDAFKTLPAIAELSAESIASSRAAIQAEQQKLNDLINETDIDTDKLEEHAKKIAEARAAVAEAEAEFVKSTKDQVLTADGSQVDQLATYMLTLQNQLTAVKTYAATLAQLRKLGLDEATEKKLLEEGTADQAFADQLLAGGKTAVEGLNKLDAQLEKESKKLGTSAGTNLYQAGVDSAAGFVKGLVADKQRLINQVEALADEIVAAFNKKLKVKSPSEVFANSGKFAMQGLAKGFSDSTQMVIGAIEGVATDALSALKRTVSNISDLVTAELDVNPVITPILDLTQVRSQAQELGNLIPITAAASYGQATAISSAQGAAQMEELAGGKGATSVKFEQNNYSPKALSEIEIYRQTRNQLSMLKSGLALT